MRERLQRFVRDRYLTTPFSIAFLLNIVAALLVFTRVVPSEQPIPLHYNTYFGIDAIGPWYAYYYLPGGGLVFLLINTGIALAILIRDRMFARIILWIAILVGLLILLSTASAIQTLL